MSEIPEHLLYGLHWTLIEVKDFVSHCFDRDALLMTLLNYGSEWLQGRLICVVSKDYVQPFMARGWASWGDDAETTSEMSNVKLPTAGSVVLQHIVNEGAYTIGEPSKVGFRKLFDETPVMEPEELVIIPLQLGGSTKMLLVGEPRAIPDDLMAFSENIRPLVDVADEVAQQLEVIIKLAKARKLPSPGERIPPLPARVAGRQLSDIYNEEESSNIDIDQEAENQRSLMQAVSTALEAGDSSMSGALFATMKPHLESGRVNLESGSASPGSEIQPGPRSRKTLPLKVRDHSTSRHTPLTPEQVATDKQTREPDVEEPPSAQPEPREESPRIGLEPRRASSPTPAVNVDVLPSLSPFDTDYGTQKPVRPRPVPLDPKEEKEDDPGVNIIAPIGLQSGPMSKQTLMGGFSMADLERAKAEFEREKRDPAKPSNTLNGIQTPITPVGAQPPAEEEKQPASSVPAAGIIRRSRKKTNPLEGQEEGTPHAATIRLEAVSREEPPKEAPQEDVSRETPEQDRAEEPPSEEEHAEPVAPHREVEEEQRDDVEEPRYSVGGTLLLGAIDRETGEQLTPVIPDAPAEPNGPADDLLEESAASEPEEASEIAAAAKPTDTKTTIPMEPIPQLLQEETSELIEESDDESEALEEHDPDASVSDPEQEEGVSDGAREEPPPALDELSSPITLQGIPEPDPEMLGDFGVMEPPVSAASSEASEDSDAMVEYDPTGDASESSIVSDAEQDAAPEFDDFELGEDPVSESMPEEDGHPVDVPKSTIPMEAIPQLVPNASEVEEEPASAHEDGADEVDEEGDNQEQGPEASSPEETPAEEASEGEREDTPDIEEFGAVSSRPGRKATMLMGALDPNVPPIEDSESEASEPAVESAAPEEEEDEPLQEAEVSEASSSDPDDAASPQPPSETDIPQERPVPKSTLPLVSPDISQEIAAEAAKFDEPSLADALEGGAEGMQAEGIAVSGDEFATRVMPAIKTQPLTEEQKKALENIDARNMAESMKAAEQLIVHPEVLQRLEKLFPGRLYVDRYQWTPQKFPPAERHGPVIKAIALLGKETEPLLINMLDHTGLDHRFYATFLLELIETEGALEGLRQRLFDRDLQTRTVAMKALTKRADAPQFEEKVLAPLREEVRHPTDELHAEQAGEFLGRAKDIKSIEPLIEALDMHRGKVQRTLHEALQRITLQPLPAASIAWRTWYLGSKQEQRSAWILRALNSPNDTIRQMVVEDVERIEARAKRDFGYHPDQPSRLRSRAQQQLREWFAKENML